MLGKELKNICFELSLTCYKIAGNRTWIHFNVYPYFYALLLKMCHYELCPSKISPITGFVSTIKLSVRC